MAQDAGRVASAQDTNPIAEARILEGSRCIVAAAALHGPHEPVKLLRQPAGAVAQGACWRARCHIRPPLVQVVAQRVSVGHLEAVVLDVPAMAR